MPAADAILERLATIANEWRWLAAVWHAALLAILVHAVLRRPRQRTIAMLLAVPMISVSALAAWSGNPFNAVMFIVLALLLARAAMRLDDRQRTVGSPFEAAAGLLLFAFGFLYPHFLAAESWLAYLYLSPVGLLPCPTLAVVTGISLIFGMFGSRRWAAILMVALIAYGGIGAVALGVWLDTMLIAGAAALLWRSAHVAPR